MQEQKRWKKALRTELIPVLLPVFPLPSKITFVYRENLLPVRQILEGFVPQYQAEVISRLEKAGMIIIGKTNMDEFAWEVRRKLLPMAITRNPWNTEHVPGGSSGASCAAVAAGEAYLALALIQEVPSASQALIVV